MKKIIIFAFIVLLSSCEKEVIVIDNPNELQTLKVDNIKDLLPLVSSDSKTKTVFYNDKGDEIIFDFILQEEIKEKKDGSIAYDAEEISGSYINEAINDYSLYFVGGGNYYKKEPVLFVTAGINQFEKPAVTNISILESGQPFIAVYYETKLLLDKEFKAVYSNFINDEFDAFSEIYYNAEYGIIGFKDREDDLYVFKEFID
jgi:hypothetical protein